MELRSFETGAGKVEKSLNRMVDSLSGRKVIQEAALMTAAVDKIGGVSKLTETELRRLGGSAQEAVEKMKRMGIDIPPALKTIADAARDTHKPTESLNISFGKLVGSFITAQAVIGAVKMAFHGMVGFVSDSVKAANDAEKAQVQLHAALRAQGTATPTVIAAFQRYGEELQRTTIYQDDAAAAAQALLVQVGNVMPRDMEKALQATANLASGLGIDLQTAALNVAKAAEGQTGALKKAGVVIDETKVKAQGFGAVLDAINDKFAGQSAAIAGTYQGRLQQLRNSWNDLQESIGRLITTNETLLTLFGQMNQSLGANKDALEQNRQAVNFVSDAVIIAVKGFGMFADGLDFAQTVGAGFIIGLRTMGIWLLETTKATLQASRALAIATGNVQALGQINAVLPAIDRAIEERIRLNASLTQSSIGVGNALQSIVARARDLEEQLGKTRGQTVALTGATDTNTTAWEQHTRATANDTKATNELKKATEDAAKAQETFRQEIISTEGVARLFRGQLRTNLPTVPAETQMGAAIRNLIAYGDEVTRLERRVQTVIDLTPRALTGPLPGFGVDVEKWFWGEKGAPEPRTLTDSLKSLTSGNFSQVFGDIGNFFKGGAAKIGTGFLEGIGGMITGGLSTLLNVGAGLLVKGLGKLFGIGPSEAEKTERMRKDWVRDLKAAGSSLEELQDRARKAGFDMDRLMDTQKTKAFTKELDKLKVALEFQDAAVSKLDAAIQRWGLSFADLGPALQKQKIHERAMELYEDFRLLQGSGVSLETVLTRMSGVVWKKMEDGSMVVDHLDDGFVKLINDARTFGISLPSYLRQPIADMAGLGLLIHENGRQFTEAEVAGLTFADTLEQGVGRLITKIEEMVDALLIFLGLADEATQRTADLQREVATIESGSGLFNQIDRKIRLPGLTKELDTLLNPATPGPSNVLDFPVLSESEQQGVTARGSGSGINVSVGDVYMDPTQSEFQAESQIGRQVVSAMKNKGVRWRKVA